MRSPVLFGACRDTDCRTGKTIKFGRARSILCLEGIDVSLCPLFSLAAYLFWRFDVDGDSVPNFLDRAEWYTARVFTGPRDGTHYTENAQYGSVRALHEKFGILGKNSVFCKMRFVV